MFLGSVTLSFWSAPVSNWNGQDLVAIGQQIAHSWVISINDKNNDPADNSTVISLTSEDQCPT